ncbi:extracellular solute-binding protein [Psychrobium sp. 1_MG-2023]|uniref:extracellular solute-binding protein n=1 Tax=Psychrobium sp. 1_MG-2023 TaxID=3062624 RepID=UPI000C3401BF|nr:extracellular solute-binding protein [Psychrobium sp. 1_MG-2023]MDP2559792.1 extracellular solute-binding protein [Psychrobium sp. 1_MG-2023]PKF59100.1 Fe(3+) ABC transporter substrate-binding protein [Alteromonadales bacterium alter-6D02]
MYRLVCVGLLMGALLPRFSMAKDQVVNVYSFRQAELINPIIEQFTQETGIKVNVVSGKADVLLQRLIKDGEDSFADVLLTSDVARLEGAKTLNLLQPIPSNNILENVPKQLRDPDGHWVGLSVRARAIFYSKERVAIDAITSYQDLTDPQWQGKICARQGGHFYNRSLVASFIYNYGKAWSENWIKMFVKNLAMRPHGGDRDQIRKVSNGQCDLAIANSYYYGMLSASKKPADRRAYANVGIIFPRDNAFGTHINISGVAITQAAKNKKNATQFIEFLTTKRVQALYAKLNYEYPIRQGVNPNGLLSSWGALSGDADAVLHLTKYHQLANEMISKSHW